MMSEMSIRISQSKGTNPDGRGFLLDDGTLVGKSLED